MRVEITGKHLDIGEALAAHAKRKLTESVQKFTVRPTEASVTFSKQGHMFLCDCLTHLSTGLTARASGEGDAPYAACDQACARLEKQLRRHKRRLRDHHQKRKEPVARFEMASYVLRNSPEPESGDSGAEEAERVDARLKDADQNGLNISRDVENDDPDNDIWRPAIIAEGTTTIATLSVGEAVMQMELADAPFMLFFNEAQSRVNAVYRREDGNIGWIDPKIGEPRPTHTG